MSSRAQPILLAAGLALAAVGPAGAGEPPAPPDKDGYTLFHPVPADQQRDFNPDRPSQFTGPFTVDMSAKAPKWISGVTSA